MMVEIRDDIAEKFVQVLEKMMSPLIVDRQAPPPSVELTGRELEVVQLLLDGQTNREIAKSLSISPHTAKFHVDRLARRFQADNRTQIVVAALRAGVITL